MSSPSIAIVGAYRTVPQSAERGRSLEEMVFEAARGALASADVSIGEVDSVVLATSDQTDGRVIESMVTAGAAGAVNRDLTTVASAGEHALIAAFLRLASGVSRMSLVVTWSKPSESVAPEHAELVGAEPFFLRPLGMNATVAAALQASAYGRRFGVHEAAAASVIVERRQAAAQNQWAHLRLPTTTDLVLGSPMISWPLRQLELPATCDMACAAVIAVEDRVEQRAAAWIAGLGWAMDAYELASRDLTVYSALRSAARQAYSRAGLEGFGRPIDVVEIQELSSVGAFAGYEAIGLAGIGEGPAFRIDESVSINPSGGSLPTNPPFAAGFVRVIEAALQVQGMAGAHQVIPVPRMGLGAGLYGFAGQGATVAILQADPPVPGRV